MCRVKGDVHMPPSSGCASIPAVLDAADLYCCQPQVDSCAACCPQSPGNFPAELLPKQAVPRLDCGPNRQCPGWTVRGTLPPQEQDLVFLWAELHKAWCSNMPRPL